MKKMLSLLMSSLLILSLSACNATTSSADQWVAKVNDSQLSYSDYEKNLAVFKKQIEVSVGSDIWTQDSGQGKTYGELLKEQVLEKLIEDQLILAEAKKEKLVLEPEKFDKDFAEFKEQIKNLPDYDTFLKENNITDEFLKKQFETDSIVLEYKQKFIEKNSVSDEELQKYYDQNSDKYYINEVKASHILIKTVDENYVPFPEAKITEAKKLAETVLAKVKAGEDFATLATTYSQDEASAVNGGDLGFFAKGVMVKEFEESAFTLQPGQTSELIQTTYGFHIIKVFEKKDEITPFEQVKDGIKNELSQKSYTDYTTTLKESSKIEKNEELIKKMIEKEATEQKTESTTEPAAEPAAEPATETKP